MRELLDLETLEFAGRIGENTPFIRSQICVWLSFPGIESNELRNGDTAEVISSDASQIKVCVICANEELMFARSVWRMERTMLERTVPPRMELANGGATP
jgi:acetate kinase